MSKSLQVLVSTMYQKDFSLLETMNIRSDAVIVNQCEKDSVLEFEFRGHTIKWINSTERGIGKSRNMAIFYSTNDILLFSDDDVVFEDNAPEVITDFFSNETKYNLATFNFESLNPKRPEKITKRNHTLFFWNCLGYGAFRIAVDREHLLKNNVFFSLLFGGGAIYQAGEDNLFITQCLRRGMKGVASNKKLGTVAQKNSTWFKGYNSEYYFDRGALFAAMYGRISYVVLLLFECKHFSKSFFSSYSMGVKGIRSYRH